jgi:hypothetical protein
MGIVCLLVLPQRLRPQKHLHFGPWRKQRLARILLSKKNAHYFNCAAADQAKHMQDQMSGAAMAMPQDPKAAFKAEWEALEICEHQWALSNVENELMGVTAPSSSDQYQ